MTSQPDPCRLLLEHGDCCCTVTHKSYIRCEVLSKAATRTCSGRNPQAPAR